MLKDKLTIEQQESILKPLFGFRFHETTLNHPVLFDEDGDEFYGCDENLKFDFSTLQGIFSYAVNRAKNQGYTDCQAEIRRNLGL